MNIPALFRKTAVLIAAFFIVPVCSAPAQNRVNERDDFHNTSYVNTDDDEMKTFFLLAAEASGKGDYPAAVVQLVRALRRGGDSVVPFGARTYLTGRAAAKQRIASLPGEAVALYLKTVSEEAARFMSAALAKRDERLLMELAARFPFTREAFTAFKMLGDLSRERGDFLEAASRYRRCLGQTRLMSAPDGEGEGVRISLYAVLLKAGRPEEAAPYAPSGTVCVGGRELEASEVKALFPLGATEVGTEGGWPTRGGSRSRARLPSFDCRKLQLVWSYRLKEEKGEEADPGWRDLQERRYLESKRVASNVYPIISRNRVCVFNEEALHVLDLDTGRPLFGPLRWDWSLLFGDSEPELENVTYSGTAAGNVLYVVVNRRSRPDDFRANHQGVLLAVDLSRDGACLWRRGSVPGEPPGSAVEGMAFSGAPAVVEDRVYLMGTKHGATIESFVCCFDATTGELLFRPFLCSGVEVSKYADRIGGSGPPGDRIELGAPIVEQEGILFCLTNLGVAASVDAFTGEVLWLFKYNRIFSQDPDSYDRAYFYDTGGWEDSLPLFRDERFFMAPADSRYLYSLARAPDPEGYIVLADPVEKGRFVSFIGTDGNLFYFTAREGGRNFIASTTSWGALVWETDLFEKEDRIAGRPLLTRTAIFVPTLRYIYRVDLEGDGLITHSFPAPGELGDLKEAVFGNIITIENRLISVSDRQVLALSP